jgi:hypothetical protein
MTVLLVLTKHCSTKPTYSSRTELVDLPPLDSSAILLASVVLPPRQLFRKLFLIHTFPEQPLLSRTLVTFWQLLLLLVQHD